MCLMNINTWFKQKEKEEEEEEEEEQFPNSEDVFN